MKQLVNNGHYWIPLSGIEYIAMPCTELQGITHILTPPSNTTYPNSTPILVATDGSLRTSEHTLSITTDDLLFGGRVHDWQNRSSTGYRNEHNTDT